MYLLVIDTSLQGLTLGLARVTGQTYDILDIYGSNQPQEAAARLPELCHALLTNQKLTIKDLGGLLVSPGPGSFTGIKIGLSFAAGWKRAGSTIKIWSVSSFRGLLKQRTDANVLLLPATQTAGYFTLRNPSGEPLMGVIDLTLPSVVSLFDEAKQTLGPLAPAHFTQVEILGAWPKLEDWLKAQNIAAKAIDTSTLYRAVVAGMIEDFVAKSHELSEGDLMPIYLRKSAPEEKLDLAKAKS